MKVNINKLRGRIVEKEMSVALVAEKMGIDKATLYRRLENDGAGLMVKDAHKLAEILDLTCDEAMAIFFADQVA